MHENKQVYLMRYKPVWASPRMFHRLAPQWLQFANFTSDSSRWHWALSKHDSSSFSSTNRWWIWYDPGFPVTYQRVSMEHLLYTFPAKHRPSAGSWRKNAGGPELFDTAFWANMAPAEKQRTTNMRNMIVWILLPGFRQWPVQRSFNNSEQVARPPPTNPQIRIPITVLSILWHCYNMHLLW